jgi:hypothetical protein
MSNYFGLPIRDYNSMRGYQDGGMTASPRGVASGALADTLLKAKAAGDRYEVKDWVPLLGGTGLGTMFMGNAPELFNDMSYYGPSAAIKGDNLATGGIGTYKPDPRTLDAAFLAADATGLASIGSKLGKAGYRKVVDKAVGMPSIEGRRDFMSKGAALAAATALGTGALKLGKQGMDALPKVADNAAATVAKKYKYNNLGDYLKELDTLADRKATVEMAAIRDTSPLFQSNAAKMKAVKKREWLGKLAAENEANYAKQKGLKSKGDKEVLDAFSPQTKEEMRAFKEWSKENDFTWKDEYEKDPRIARIHDAFGAEGDDGLFLPQEYLDEITKGVDMDVIEESYRQKAKPNFTRMDEFLNPPAYDDVPF